MAKLVFFIVLAVGAFATWFAVRNLARGLDSKRWPTALGTVLASDVTVSRSSDSDGSTSTTFGAKITYQYKVDGREHIGDRRSFADYKSNSSARAYRIAHQYPAGSQITVYYHPERPELCVLEPGVNWSSFAVVAFGLLFTAVGLLGVLGAIGPS